MLLNKNLKHFPTLLVSLRASVLFFFAGIYAQIGDVSKFISDNKLPKSAGITWRKTQSGKFNDEETRLTITGSNFLRYYLAEAQSH